MTYGHDLTPFNPATVVETVVIGAKHNHVLNHVVPTVFSGDDVANVVFGFIPTAENAAVDQKLSDQSAKCGALPDQHITPPGQDSLLSDVFAFQRAVANAGGSGWSEGGDNTADRAFDGNPRRLSRGFTCGGDLFSLGCPRCVIVAPAVHVMEVQGCLVGPTYPCYPLFEGLPAASTDDDPLGFRDMVSPTLSSSACAGTILSPAECVEAPLNVNPAPRTHELHCPDDAPRASGTASLWHVDHSAFLHIVSRKEVPHEYAVIPESRMDGGIPKGATYA